MVEGRSGMEGLGGEWLGDDLTGKLEGQADISSVRAVGVKEGEELG